MDVTLPQIPRVPVESTSIVSIGYDAASATLDVEFVNGHLYRYEDVPAEVFCGLIEAESKGRFVTAFIREVYPYRRVR